MKKTGLVLLIVLFLLPVSCAGEATEPADLSAPDETGSVETIDGSEAQLPDDTSNGEAIDGSEEQPPVSSEEILPVATLPPGAERFRRIIFLHHSTGAGLIATGGLRERLTALGYEFYDHGYNEEGLTLADGNSAGVNFAIPDDNTNPDGFAAIFAQPVNTPPDNAFSYLMQYDVIAFKSCFPASDIQSDEQLAEYQLHYRNLRAVMDQYPAKVFIVITPPPLVPSATSPEVAARARTFARWLGSPEYLNGHPNVFAFDLFNLLAAPDSNMLRASYISAPDDSHPNERANQLIAPQLADFIVASINRYAGR